MQACARGSWAQSRVKSLIIALASDGIFSRCMTSDASMFCFHTVLGHGRANVLSPACGVTFCLRLPFDDRLHASAATAGVQSGSALRSPDRGVQRVPRAGDGDGQEDTKQQMADGAGPITQSTCGLADCLNNSATATLQAREDAHVDVLIHPRDKIPRILYPYDSKSSAT
jgi:hypothetical protein